MAITARLVHRPSQAVSASVLSFANDHASQTWQSQIDILVFLLGGGNVVIIRKMHKAATYKAELEESRVPSN